MADASERLFTGQRLSEFIKIGSVLASIAAFIYLYGFSFSAKVNILAYVSFSDYIRIAIGWILPSLIVPLLGYFIPDYSKPVNQAKDTEAGCDCPICEYERKELKRLKQGFAILGLSILILVLTVYFVKDMKWIFKALTLVVISGWLIIYVLVTKSAENIIKIGREKNILLLFVIPFFIFSFGFGLAHGAISGKVSRFSSDFAEVTTKNESQIYGEFMFSLEKFTVIREVGHTDLTFISTDSVESIKMPVSIPPSAPKP